MSSCKAPNCDLKNFSQCNSSLQFCSLQGIGIGEEPSSRECNPKDSGIVNYLRTAEECNITPGVNDEFECKKKVGCEWTYPSTFTDDLLEKRCVPNKKGVKTQDGGRTQASYTCSQASVGSNNPSSWIIGDNRETGRYSIIEPDTFGCPKDRCDYTPRRSTRVDGICVHENRDSSQGCEAYSSVETCINEPTCKWEPNDSAYCGYNRSIKAILGDRENIDDVVGDMSDDICKQITQPSEETCNNWGCIWDINGKREPDIDYDIKTSGICTYPNTINCMNNYCSQNTRSSASGKRRGYHPDGRCKRGEMGPEECVSSERMIIPHKTPGLMELPGHTSDESTEINNLQRVISEKHRKYKEDVRGGNNNLFLNDKGEGEEIKLGARSKFKNDITNLYKESCEKRGKYPGPADAQKTFIPNKYDVTLKTCADEDGDSNMIDLCDKVKSNVLSNDYEEYLEYYKDAKCIFTGSKDNIDTLAMKAAKEECGDECNNEQDVPSAEKVMMYGRNKCLTDGKDIVECHTVDFSGECKEAGTPVEANTEAECKNHKWTGNCTGTSTEITRCDGIANDNTKTCDLDPNTDGTEECPEGCTPTFMDCERDPSTMKCPVGCGESEDAGECSDGISATKSDCEDASRGNRTWTGKIGICQWHDPNERCRVKEDFRSEKEYLDTYLEKDKYKREVLVNDQSTSPLLDVPSTSSGHNSFNSWMRCQDTDGDGVYTLPGDNCARTYESLGKCLNNDGEEITCKRNEVNINTFGYPCEGDDIPLDNKEGCESVDGGHWYLPPTNRCYAPGNCKSNWFRNSEEASSGSSRDTLKAHLQSRKEYYTIHEGFKANIKSILNTRDEVNLLNKRKSIIDFLETKGDPPVVITTHDWELRVKRPHTNNPPDDYNSKWKNIEDRIDKIIYNYDRQTEGDKEEIINNLVHYLITLIDVWPLFEFTSSDTITIEDDKYTPFFNEGDTVKIVNIPGSDTLCDNAGEEVNITITGPDVNTLTLNSPVAAHANCRLRPSNKLVYDIGKNLYRVEDNEKGKYANLYQLSTEEYPILNGIIYEGDYNAYFENAKEMDHKIKDIVYSTGKATILLEVIPAGNEEAIQRVQDKLEHVDDNVIKFNYRGDEGKQLKTAPEKYTLNSVKRYLNGMIEIEIDGVDPGKIGGDKLEFKGKIDSTLRGFHTIDGLPSGNDAVVREILFHDIKMDIYFESDIRNLYKKNDIIEIDKIASSETSIREFKKNFNTGFSLKDSSTEKIYSRITDVDFIKNKITINNVKRSKSGKYYPGRYKVEPASCVIQTISGTPEVSQKDFIKEAEYASCYYKEDVWKGCLTKNGTCSSSTDKKCRDRRINIDYIETYCMKDGKNKVGTTDCGEVTTAPPVDVDAAGLVSTAADSGAAYDPITTLERYFDYFLTTFVRGHHEGVNELPAELEKLKAGTPTGLCGRQGNLCNVGGPTATTEAVERYLKYYKAAWKIYEKMKYLHDHFAEGCTSTLVADGTVRSDDTVNCILTPAVADDQTTSDVDETAAGSCANIDPAIATCKYQGPVLPDRPSNYNDGVNILNNILQILNFHDENITYIMNERNEVNMVKINTAGANPKVGGSNSPLLVDWNTGQTDPVLDDQWKGIDPGYNKNQIKELLRPMKEFELKINLISDWGRTIQGFNNGNFTLDDISGIGDGVGEYNVMRIVSAEGEICNLEPGIMNIDLNVIVDESTSAVTLTKVNPPDGTSPEVSTDKDNGEFASGNCVLKPSHHAGIVEDIIVPKDDDHSIYIVTNKLIKTNMNSDMLTKEACTASVDPACATVTNDGDETTCTNAGATCVYAAAVDEECASTDDSDPACAAVTNDGNEETCTSAGATCVYTAAVAEACTASVDPACAAVTNDGDEATCTNAAATCVYTEQEEGCDPSITPNCFPWKQSTDNDVAVANVKAKPYKLEIELDGHAIDTFNQYKCLPNDVRYINGKKPQCKGTEDSSGTPCAFHGTSNECTVGGGDCEYSDSKTLKDKDCSYRTLQEIEHEYALPNELGSLERAMCSPDSNTAHQIVYDSIFKKDSTEREFSFGTQAEGIFEVPKSKLSKLLNGITLKDGELNEWVIEYIVKREGNFYDKEIGIIRDFLLSEDNYTFTIYIDKGGVLSNGFEPTAAGHRIYPLSIYEKITGFNKEEVNKVKIKNYIRKEVNELEMISDGELFKKYKYFRGITNMDTCEYNNGIWEGLDCKTHDINSRIRNTDICEYTGYTWDEDSNICKLNSEYDYGHPTATYCDGKVNVDEVSDSGEDPPVRPCPTCKYDDSNNKRVCKGQTEKDCMKHSTKDTCELDKTCEYYIDLMEPPGPGLKPQSVFNCKEKPGSTGDSSTCITKTNPDECEVANCEWQCPFTPDSRNQQGYVVKKAIDGVSSPNTTLNNQTDNYYSPSDLTVTCDPAWEQSETSVSPSLTCIENVNPDPRVDEHTHRIASIGCRPKIKCGENKIENEPITGNVLRSLNLNQVPDVFKTGAGNNEAIDPTKFPNSQGSFKCPEPQILRDNASEIPHWNKEQCCYSTGLCKDNTEPSEDVACPTGKIHKKAYYGESTEYLPAQGTTEEVCCIVPEAPTITVPLDADYDEIAGSAGTVIRDTFEQNFCSDIVTILNASEHIDIPVTSTMCEILDINEGSVVVTFRLNKNTDGNVVLTDQISKAISAGTTFPTVGAVSNAEPHYKPYDPKAKYLFWSDTLKKGITLEQLIITIFMFLCIISSGLAVMGIILK
tara:strand:+ start:4577 stop:12769 length:8193 start_codon:yes stop_codon:yes gene_type:complete